MKNLSITVLIAFLPLLTIAQAPVKQAYAYSRSTTSGIPGQSNTPFPPTYFIYLVVTKGADISVAGVYVAGKYYKATIEKKDTPVYAPDEVANTKKQTLVPKTSNDVYQVYIGEPNTANVPEKKLATSDQLVIFFPNGHYTTAKITKLPPTPGM